jgi:ribosomal protein L20A (L18A)
MIWEEFTEYIIEALQKVEKPVTDNKNYMEKEIIENAYSKLGREYKLERTAELNLQSAIRKIYCISAINTFFTLEKNTNNIRLYDMDFH